jgi:aminodeoxyfutalosine synthase
MEGMTLETVAERASRGDELSGDEARAVLETRDLIAVASIADEVRRLRRGAVTTFVRVMEIHTDAPPASLPQGVTAGEFRVVGRPSSEAAALSAVRAVAALAGTAPVTGFSLADLVALAAGSGSLSSLCSRLREAGLSAVAEVPIDLLQDAVDAVRAARDGGLSVLRMTVQSLDSEQRVSIVERARALQERVGRFRAFAPLPRAVPAAAPTTGYDDVKQVALARLMLRDDEAIQVDWSLYGPKLAQVALTMGADDVDGVAAMETGNLGARRSAIEDITRNIRAAGLEPLERNGLFERLGR